MPSSSLLLLVGLLSLWTELIPVSGWKKHDRCLQPLDFGQCEDQKPHYYYNQNSKKCKKFDYRGCKGNGNNFESFKECIHQCIEKPGVCPKAPPGMITICLAKCGSDWQCERKQKCCPYGCLVDCVLGSRQPRFTIQLFRTVHQLGPKTQLLSPAGLLLLLGLLTLWAELTPVSGRYRPSETFQDDLQPFAGRG
ncbi:protease inhibitor 3-like [Crotalus adamanteus]|uniref:Protease inhibitor 3-like n=1 Tax=Crotalus adamanteus TaxID=8729 RepID=A0AAW1BSQ1_CROAD